MNTQTLELSSKEQTRFSGLMQDTYRKVYNMAFRLSGNRSDAEDLTQEAFFRAYRSFKDYEGDKPFENWIFRILTRLFLDLLRSRRRRIQAASYDAPLPTGEDSVHFEVPDTTMMPGRALFDNTYSEDLQTALASLSEEQRNLVLLADVEGVPYAEIAQLLGKPVGTIRSRLHRTHKLMRSRLEAIKAKKEKPHSAGCNGGLCLCP